MMLFDLKCLSRCARSGNNVDWERIPVIHNTVSKHLFANRVSKQVFTGISVEFFTLAVFHS